jgi:hypothetical protein
MTLTRNLYEMDEVVSSLQICLCNGWPRGLFWLWELVVSDEDANDTLRDAWLYWGGGYDPTALTETDWIAKYNRIAAAIRSAGSRNALQLLREIGEHRPSLTPIAKRTAEIRRVRSAAFVESLDPSERTDAANFWISYDSACRQGSRRDAIWLLQAAQHRFSSDAIWSAISIAARGPTKTREAIALLKTANLHPISQILHQAAATLLLCTPSALREEQMAPTQTTSRLHREIWDRWTADVGTRHARVYAIQHEALHMGTTRGQMESKYTNIGDLRDPVLVEGCQFWRSALAEYGITTDETGATIFPDDDVLERFYDRYFPTDIPDEWSKKDQEKSHGRGCSSSVEPVSVPMEPVSDLAWKHAILVRQKS